MKNMCTERPSERLSPVGVWAAVTVTHIVMAMRLGGCFIALFGVLHGAPCAAQTLKRLPEREVNALALKAETTLRLQQDRALRVGFHRKSSFRLALPGGKSLDLTSLTYAGEDGSEPHCVLAVEQRQGITLLNPLEGEDDPPWSCDGEPALQWTDLTGDAQPEMLVIYPYRPPSGERFWQSFVLHLDAREPSLDWDQKLTQQLRQAAQARPITSLESARHLLKR